MRRWVKILGLLSLLAVLAAGAAAVVALRSPNQVGVESGRVTRRDISQTVTAAGEIKPRSYVNLSSSAFGRILRLAVEEGDDVERGQFLLQIEAVQTEANVESAQSALDAAQADLEGMEASIRSARASLDSTQADQKRIEADYARAQNEFGRAQALFEDGLISREEFERQEAALLSAETQVTSAASRLIQVEAQLSQTLNQRDSVTLRMGQQRANLTRARDELDQTTITAPLSGVITYLPVNEGENAIVGVQNQPGTTLMTIADMSVITAEVRVDETDIVSLRLGQPVEIRVDALGERLLEGTVSEIGNSALTASGAPATSSTSVNTDQARDFKVVITLNAPPPELRPGLSCQVRIETASRTDAVVVPIQALTVREIDLAEVPDFVQDPLVLEHAPGEPELVEQEGVFVIENGVARFQPVVTGIVGTTEIEVLAGLEAGTEIATGPYRTLRTLTDETAVRLIAAGSTEP
jgi:HlyD family secretion protein